MLRLALALVLGSIIGLEREINNRPAGFRTHILVCIGAALFTLISIYGIKGGDPARIAAQVVSGIGFLGAGTILREGNTIRGLTTAASLWSVAGVGMAIGAGFYLGAVMTTAFMIIVLFLFNNLERRILQSQYHALTMDVSDTPGQLGRIGAKLGDMGVSIRTIEITSQNNQQVQLELGIKIPAQFQVHQVVNELADVDGVYTIKFEEE